MTRIVVLVSGNGSNLQAIIDACANGDIQGQVCAVFSNKEEAYGLERARTAAIPAHALSHKNFADRLSFDLALMKQIDEYQPDLVVLAGYMRILSDEFVEHYLGKMINIHPSLLPKYPGLNTHQRAIDAGDSEHGSTVHFVTPELDSGPIVGQVKVAITASDDAESLMAKVQKAEHQLYPDIVRKIVSGEISWNN
ncbi:phosphoribosylglycinamide formyltransferase [Vibrio comitans]|uniref:Phosphoribosylglycinamide formyltransferase n=1 Tax=Vibrio comitans NBRC 102076 TaxID=1219078 RepID=A0A4Y3IL86_9VIBR|nr:phosphoribosylglycinamide formyltransferase [Vibrio comitans]GEA59514.1 phosphoribosylglycinamide formyltransferase [Vibrio comitans NBRC 102076]